MLLDDKPAKYSVEWSLDNGADIDCYEVKTLKEAKKFANEHINDKEKEDMHIKIWRFYKAGESPFTHWEGECIDSLELEDIGLKKGK